QVVPMRDQASRPIQFKDPPVSDVLVSRGQEIVDQITDTSERSAEAISNRLQSLQDAANEAIEKSQGTPAGAAKGGERQIEAEEAGRRFRNDGNARHVALGHDRAVRAPARGQRAVA